LKEIFQNLASILRNKAANHRVGHIYAVNSGKFVGEFFVLVEKTNAEFRFLSIPKMLRRVVPIADMDRGIKNKIITPVKHLPKPIFEICRKQYHHNTKLDKIVDKRIKEDK
jgi:hypothetical protein